jgi:Co/Zn/Cd efflux system component
MSAHCCTHEPSPPRRAPHERRVLWAALAINAAMFVVELVAGSRAGSSSLQADSLDFLADAANYAVSLFVVTSVLRVRARAALAKGASMGLLGLWVLGHTAWQLWHGVVPRAEVMGVVGALALASNLFVLWLLVSFRRGDANMRSVWICSRNDSIANVAVLLAASGVLATRTAWPDAAVAVGIAALSLSGAWQIVRSALRELAEAEAGGRQPTRGPTPSASR